MALPPGGKTEQKGNAMKISTGINSNLKTGHIAGVIAVLLSVGFGALVLAQELTDNETCMMCHAAFEWVAPENADRPRVHNDDGTHVQEMHGMFSCVNCHQDIAEIPHAENVERGVDCLTCHEAVPQK
jgi:hypothetical protein